MSNNKKFDCVKMKMEIQQKLARDYAGLSEAEILQRQERSIRKNAILRKFLLMSKSQTGKHHRQELVHA